MRASRTAPVLPEGWPLRYFESASEVPTPILLHTPGPIPPIDDDDDEDEDRRGGGGGGGNIDPDDDEDVGDDDEDEDDDADKQWAARVRQHAGSRFVL